MRKTGSADLPLHTGRVPAWLAERMRRLAGPLAELILLEFGEEGFLSRLADPLWFQGFARFSVWIVTLRAGHFRPLALIRAFV